MFKLFENEEKAHHFITLIENENYTSIIEKMEKGDVMNEKETNLFNKLVIDKIQNEGIMFLSDLYKEGFNISDEWLLRWTKTKKFITNYNIPVYGNEYFKKRLETIAPEILTYYMQRMDNLSMSVANSYKVGFIQAVEVLMSVRNYSKIIEHIESGISDNKLLEYIQKIRKLNKTIEESPTFYKELEDNVKVSDCLKDLQLIMQKRTIDKKQLLLPENVKNCIRRIHYNYEKCIENKSYLKIETLDLLEKIHTEKVLFIMNKYKENNDKELLLKELEKIDTAIASVVIGINRKKITQLQDKKIVSKNRI